MIKVTLLGDSIRQQYEPHVRKLLGDDFLVVAPSENCRFSKYMLRGMFDWRNLMEGSRIVHFNVGHWDINDLGFGIFTSEEEFKENLIRIATILKSRYDVVIFSTTTPVTYNNVYNKNDVIVRYNKLAEETLRPMGVIINDLNSPLAVDIDKYICNDTIHLSAEGIDLCAKLVSDLIRSVASTLPEEEKDENKAGEDGLGAPVLI